MGHLKVFTEIFVVYTVCKEQQGDEIGFVIKIHSNYLAKNVAVEV